MKKAITIGVLGILLSSCSLLQRHDDPELEPAEKTEAESSPSVESEVSRLNTKIAALETKLDVLTNSMERMQAQSAQPVIEAEASPQPNLAAPVDVPEQMAPAQVSAAPSRPTALPVSVKSPEASPAANSAAEKDFRAAMVLFQNGKHAEAASKFGAVAQKYPQHLLASHALYWAGEANARSQQWSSAAESWEELEKHYPRSAYLPEALAGLARAYENQGETGKAKTYRDTLLRAFPKSPVVLSLHSEPEKAVRKTIQTVSTGEEENESAPVFEEDKSEPEGQ